MKQDSIQKMLKAAACKLESRPVLQDILYKDGDVYACDSHQLVKFSGVTDSKINMKINAISLLPDTENNYPDLERVINIYDDTMFTIDLDDIKKVVDFLKQDKKAIACFTANVFDNKVYLDLDNDSKLVLPIKKVTGADATINFSVEYLYNCLSNLKAFHKEYAINENEVVFKLGKTLQPFTVNYGSMLYLITPIRKYD